MQYLIQLNHLIILDQVKLGRIYFLATQCWQFLEVAHRTLYFEIYHFSRINLVASLMDGGRWDIYKNISQKYLNGFYILFTTTSCRNLPTNIYWIKINNENTRKRCEICSKLRIQNIANLEHIPHLFLVFILLTLTK